MALALPDWPYPARMTPRLVTARATLTPAMGGDIQRINRMGTRHALDIDLPIMTYEAAQAWSAIDDEESTVTIQIVQPGLDVGAPGSLVRVAGAGQSGSTLNIDGLTPYYALRRRQWISVSTGSRLYAYRVKTEVVADVNGAAAVTLTTMLRTAPGDNDVVEVAAPRLEGFATPADDAWTINEAGHVALSFSIEERG